MLVNFTFSNFQSYRDQEEFSTVAGRIPEGRNTCFPVSKTSRMRLLPLAAMYGANAAGKSNFVQALRWLQNMVDKGEVAHFPFELDEDSAETPSGCEVVMLLGEEMWGYRLSSQGGQVVEESLFRLSGGREELFFERYPREKKFRFGRAFAFKEKGAENFARRLGETLPPTKLYLSTVISFETPEIGERVRCVHHWLTHTLCVVGANGYRAYLSRDLNEAPELYGEALRKADTGIVGLGLVPVSMKETMISEGQLEKFRHSKEKELFSVTGAFKIVKEGGEMKAYRWVTKHPVNRGGRNRDFDLGKESEGTLQFLNLLPILLDQSDEQRVYVIDELDRRLHPELVNMLLRKHLEQARDGVHRQLIFTTHNVQLLEEDILRRDEIWFVEKDREGISHLIPLSDFKVRQDMNLRKGYLDGRFGGVPTLLNFRLP